MPKEQVNFPGPFVPRDPSKDGSTDDPIIHGESWPEPTVHVRWLSANRNIDGHVQIAIEAPRDYLKMLTEGDGKCSFGDMPGVYSPAMTRSELNRFILLLKRARDQAYGKDQ